MIKSNIDNLCQTANAASGLRFRSAACSRGAVSGSPANNEAWFVSDTSDLIVVADGLDRRPIDASAARIACRSLVESLGALDSESPTDVTAKLSDALWRASRELRRTSFASESQNVGSSVVLGVRYDYQFLIKSVGDARAYLVRDGRATQLTADQTVDGVLAGIGAPRKFGVSNLRQQTLLSFLGQHDFVPNDEVRLVTSRAGDRYVFCTDAVTNGIDGSRIAAILSGAATPKEAAEDLVNLSCDKQDDATFVVVFVDEAEGMEHAGN